MLKIFAFLLVAGYCSAVPIHLEFPVSGSSKCILIDVNMNNSLTWTDKDKTLHTVPNWDFTNSSTLTGSCSSSTRNLAQQFAADGAVYTFSFTDSADGEVSLVMGLNFIPNNVFKIGTKTAVMLETKPMKLGKDDSAYKCNDIDAMMVSKTVGDDRYDMTVRLNEFEAQAFNVVNDQYSNVSRCEDAVSTVEPATTEPPKPTVKPTTEPPKPTSEPPKPTSEPPKPTSEPPKPTSEPPKPTSEPPATTEPAAPNTTVPVTTEPTKPTPAPTSSHPTQTVAPMDSGKTCIVLKGQFLFTLPYQKKDGTNATASVGLQDINVNKTMASCNSTQMNSVHVVFYEDWEMDLGIMSNEKAGLLTLGDDTKYNWHELNITYYMTNKTFPDFNGTEGTKMMHSKMFGDGQFQATVAGSYMCDSDTTTDLGDNFKLETWDLQYKAFQAKNDTDFSSNNVQECSADAKTNSIVPIAVGAALAGLVVIVLIAYLIGRRRNRKGYESV